MRTVPKAFALALLALVLTVSFAAEGPGQAADSAAIAKLFETFNNVANERDAHAMAALFADDADFININGIIEHGPAAIEAHMQQLFAGVGRHLQRQATLRAIRFLKPDTAVLYSDTETRGMPGREVSSAPEPGFYDWIVMKRQGRWQIVVWHESNVMRAGSAGAR